MTWMFTNLQQKATHCKNYLSQNHKGELHVVYHPETGNLLYVTRFAEVVRSMLEDSLGLEIIIGAKSRVRDAIDYQELPWNWRCTSDGWIVKDLHVLDPRDVSRYELIMWKCYALEYVLNKVDGRYQEFNEYTSPLQAQVYLQKAQQARLVKDGTTDLLSVYHVHSWAKLRSIPLDQAAEEILFKHEQSQLRLYQIEDLRLSSSRAIKLSKSLKDLDKAILLYDKAGKTYE